MKIDKSKLTSEELELYEKLTQKATTDDGEEDSTEPSPAEKKEEGVGKKEECAESKELHPEVKKAIQEMEEMKKSFLMKEFEGIAKKYIPLGKKPEELAKTLYDMKKAGDEAYNEFVAVLDQSLDTVEKSGIFTEIGKSSRTPAGGSVLSKIETAASEIQKAEPAMSRPEAIAKAWENHPELVTEYDKEYEGGMR